MRLVLAGWALLSVAWLLGNPPFAGPDEGSHYLRALEVGRGHPITEHRPDAARGATERQVEWNRELTYEVRVPAGMAPHDFGCYVGDRDASAACLDDFEPPRGPTRTVTPVGNYEPLPYLLPGVALRAADSPGPALRWARAANALLTLVLLGVALRLAWSPDAGPLSLLGPIVAVTPMAIFCGSVLNGSGPEIAAAIAFACALLRLRRDPTCARSPRVWAAVGATGALLALARALGPLWLVLIAAAVAGLVGARAAYGLVRAGGRRAAAALAAVAVATGLNLAWESAHGPHVDVGLANARAVVDDAVSEWWRASSELVGKFSYLEFRLPAVAYVAWFAAGFALIAVAAAVAARRERAALLAALAAGALLPMALFVVAIRQTGFGLQGRYVLPVLAAIPIAAGDVLRERAASVTARTRRALLIGIPAAAAAVHLVAWYWNARRVAVGSDGPLVFVGSAEWSPPLGWLPWLALAAIGAALVAAAPLRLSRGWRA
ncbi:MAG TPA: DUF2142 domain-containing protein [Thermoleophilaceae bacterium]